MFRAIFDRVLCDDMGSLGFRRTKPLNPVFSTVAVFWVKKYIVWMAVTVLP